jgi:hypothetical protein
MKRFFKWFFNTRIGNWVGGTKMGYFVFASVLGLLPAGIIDIFLPLNWLVFIAINWFINLLFASQHPAENWFKVDED